MTSQCHLGQSKMYHSLLLKKKYIDELPLKYRYFLNYQLKISTTIATAYSLMDYRIDVELLKSFYFNSFLIFKNKKH